MLTSALIIGEIVYGIGLFQSAKNAYNDSKSANMASNLNMYAHNLKQYAGIESNKEFNAYLRDAVALGYIDGDTYKQTLAAYTKLKDYNYNPNKLTDAEKKSVINLYNQLYENDYNFKSLWDNKYSQLSDDEKLALLQGGSTVGMTIPAPAYLDTSFERYQKEVAPLTHYTNKELADLYKIDYNFENIKRDYDKAAEAQVVYTDWLSDLLGNNAERDNTQNTTSYLDAIRNIKSEAIQNGMSNGARAAAELLANNEAIKNKALTNTDVATQRFEAMNDSLLNRAQTELNTLNYYKGLANTLGSTSEQLYANDVNRMGQDLLANANFLAADENLRSNRMAQNNLMSSMYNNISAQNAGYSTGVNNTDWLFNNVYLPAANGNVTEALSDFIGTQYKQGSGFEDPMSKWGNAVYR